MRSGLAAAALLLVAAAACHRGGPEPRIVFQSDRSGRWAIYAVRPDGSEITQVAEVGGYYAGFAVWSRGGERVFIPAETAKGGEAIVIDTRTRARTRVRVHAVGGASWSPDGRQLAVAAERGIVVIDADGSNRRQLTYKPIDSEPTWSPNGVRIAFASGSDLYTIRTSGEINHVLTAGGDDVFAPRWSNDGRWLAFGRFGDAERAPLEVVRPDGSARREVAPDAEQALWSPRESALLYVSAGDVFRVDPDGRNRRRLTFGGPEWSFDRSPSWSPNGKQIAYVNRRLARGIRSPPTPTDVWVMNADGSGKRPVTRAFPTGGTNVFTEWVQREPKGTTVRATGRLVPLPPRDVLRTRQPIAGLMARGASAVVVAGLGSATEFDNPPGPLVFWDPMLRETRRVPIRGCGSARSPALAGSRVAYICDNSAVDLYERELRAASGGRTTTIVRLRATHLVGAPFPSRLFRGFAAVDGAIAFGVGERPQATTGGFRVHQTTLWRVDGIRTRKVRALAGDAWVLDADAAHVAVLRDGRVVVLDVRTGDARRQLTFPRNDVRDAELHGSRIVVLRRAQLDVYDVASGQRRVSQRLPRDLGGLLRLGGVEREIAVYVAGVAVHLLRLTDGRDVVVDLRTAAEPVYARLTSAGLFYSYTDPRRRPAGRAVFVPLPEVERALR